MALRVVILYSDDKIYAEFNPNKFRELFKQYFEKYKDIDKAFDKIIEDIKKESNRK